MNTPKFTPDKLIRAARLSLAMLISFVYTAYIGVSDGIWVMMTCAIVLFDNPTLGGTINKSHLRFWGTFIAAALAMVFIVGFANNVIINLIAIVLGVFLATYWFMDTKQGYAGGLITWTLPIILINNNNIKGAFLRLLNISIGILISYILLRFFYPEYARNKMLISMKNTMIELQTMLKAINDPNLNELQIQSVYLKNEVTILSQINSFMRWQDEAKTETKGHPEYVDSAVKAYLHVRRLYRLLSVIIFHFDCNKIRHNQNIQHKFSIILQQMELIIQALNKNYSTYYMPENLIIPEHYSLTLDKDEYIHHQALSTLTISEIIHEEINGVIGNLVIFFQSRKANNYY